MKVYGLSKIVILSLRASLKLSEAIYPLDDKIASIVAFSISLSMTNCV